MKRYWDGEWPNLNDISITLDPDILFDVSIECVGAIYVLHHYIGAKTVHGQFSEIENDPFIENDVKKISRILGCSHKRWHKIKDDVLHYFDVTETHIRIKNFHWVRVTKDAKRKPLPITLRQSILDRDGHACTYCGGTDEPFHIDHVIPVAKGGSDDPANLTVACAQCNLSKSDKSVQEWQNGQA